MDRELFFKLYTLIICTGALVAIFWPLFSWKRTSNWRKQTDERLLERARKGEWVYEGMRDCWPKGRWPGGRVIYPETDHWKEERSVVMALGNAVHYAEIFGGRVEVVR